MDVNGTIVKALNARAVDLAGPDAATIFRQALKTNKVMPYKISPEDMNTLSAVVDTSGYTFTNEAYPSGHPINCVLREMARSELDAALADYLRLNVPVLFLGSSDREIRKYWSFPNAYFHVHGGEAKDGARTGTRAVLEIYKRAARKDPSGAYAQVGPMPGEAPEAFLDAAYRDPQVPYSNRRRIFEGTSALPSVQVIVAEDSAYNLDKHDYLALFEHTGAHVMLGYMLLPMELVEPRLFETPLYSYCERTFSVLPQTGLLQACPDSRVAKRRLETCGFPDPRRFIPLPTVHSCLSLERHTGEGGYAHSKEAWSTLLRHLRLSTDGLTLDIEFRASYGPIKVFRIVAGASGGTGYRLLRCPKWHATIQVLDLQAKMFRGAYDPRAPHKYVSFPAEVVLYVYNIVLRCPPERVTLEAVISTMHKASAGLTVGSKTAKQKWWVDERDFMVLAAGAIVQARITREASAQFLDAPERVGAVVGLLRAVGDLLRAPFSVLIEWLHRFDLTNKVFVFLDPTVELLVAGQSVTGPEDNIAWYRDVVNRAAQDAPAYVQAMEADIQVAEAAKQVASAPAGAVKVGPEDGPEGQTIADQLGDADVLERFAASLPKTREDTCRPKHWRHGVMHHSCEFCRFLSSSGAFGSMGASREAQPKAEWQEFVCDGRGGHATLNVAYTAAMHRALDSVLSEDIGNAAGGLAKVLQECRDNLPVPPDGGEITHTVQVSRVDAGPGAGKSFTTGKLVRACDAVLVPFSQACKELRDLIPKFGHVTAGALQVCTPHKAFGPKGFTMARALFVDEAYVHDWALVSALIVKLRPERLVLIGDPRQTRIQEIEGLPIAQGVPTFDDVPVHRLVYNFRNPRNVVHAINRISGHTMIPTRGDDVPVEVKPIASVLGDKEYNSWMQMCYTKVAASNLLSHVQDSLRDKMTVRAQQGRTVTNAVLHTTDADTFVASVHGMSLVAISRHTNRLIITYDSWNPTLESLFKVFAPGEVTMPEELEALAATVMAPTPTPKTAPVDVASQDEPAGQADEGKQPAEEAASASEPAVAAVADLITFSDQEDTDDEEAAYWRWWDEANPSVVPSLVGEGETEGGVSEVASEAALDRREAQYWDTYHLFDPENPNRWALVEDGVTVGWATRTDRSAAFLRHDDHDSDDRWGDTDPCRDPDEDPGGPSDTLPLGGGGVAKAPSRWVGGDISCPTVATVTERAPGARTAYEPATVVDGITAPAADGSAEDLAHKQAMDAGPIQAALEVVMMMPSVPVVEVQEEDITAPPIVAPTLTSMDAFQDAHLFTTPVALIQGESLNAKNLADCGEIVGGTVNLLPMLAPTSRRGKPKEFASTFFSMGPGEGIHQNNAPGCVLKTVAARYLNRSTKQNVTLRDEVLAEQMVQRWMDVSASGRIQDYLTDELIDEITTEFLVSAREKKYFQKLGGQQDHQLDDAAVHLTIKEMFKPFYGRLDDDKLDKPGQGIAAWGVHLQAAYCCVMRIITRGIELMEAGAGSRTRDRFRVVTDERRTESKYIQCLTTAMQAAGGDKWAVLDGIMFDANQGEFTQLLEVTYLKAIGVPLELLEAYYWVRKNWKLVNEFVTGHPCGQKTSGEPATKLLNGIISKIYGVWCLDWVGPVVVTYKGDDFALGATHVVVSEGRYRAAMEASPLKLTLQIGDGAEFCGLVVYGLYMVPSVMRRAAKLVAARYKDYEDFQVVAPSIRNFSASVEEHRSRCMDEYGHDVVVAANCALYDRTEGQVTAAIDFIQSLGHISRADFYRSHPEHTEGVYMRDADGRLVYWGGEGMGTASSNTAGTFDLRGFVTGSRAKDPTPADKLKGWWAGVKARAHGLKAKKTTSHKFRPASELAMGPMGPLTQPLLPLSTRAST